MITKIELNWNPLDTHSAYQFEIIFRSNGSVGS